MPPGEWGDTGVVQIKGETVIQIRVSNELSDAAQVMVLAHELAHALAWRSDHEEEDRANRFGGDGMHCAEFGIAYAQVWATDVSG